MNIMIEWNKAHILQDMPYSLSLCGMVGRAFTKEIRLEDLPSEYEVCHECYGRERERVQDILEEGERRRRELDIFGKQRKAPTFSAQGVIDIINSEK